MPRNHASRQYHQTVPPDSTTIAAEGSSLSPRRRSGERARERRLSQNLEFGGTSYTKLHESLTFSAIFGRLGTRVTSCNSSLQSQRGVPTAWLLHVQTPPQPSPRSSLA